ncbi:eukaryotic-type carbonic anhydrase family protein (macronuclear) [Tetrahymena thermophila SB210]|uniref:Eukaryotic-type carbonic anhydrase family protein n=1 Tax=Tetrahymena thermophila (strain SB210) TaxID=312017 RepID=Q23AT4_TETTS|nr:eukaryotic-type carbonic anhydrase family protein [Tetrahymena thermophila SB210]EAR93608.2 eukaryotic-type carbonic anhydrase family protein [Tetrahymena thermophila SB210]|eukprot:XP_001013853.2 eukaryotic-type carbonic anhydrase family protein [Tetrahymena thermophila SB210]
MRHSSFQYSSTPDHYANSYHTQSQQNFALKQNTSKGGGRSSQIIQTSYSNQQYTAPSQQQINSNYQNSQTTQNSLPPTSSISMKLKNSLIIQKEAQKNKENVFRLKERVEEAQKRVDNLEKYEKSFSEMTHLLNGIAKDFKQSYVVSRTSYSPSGQQKSQVVSRHMAEDLELNRGKGENSQIFSGGFSNNPTIDYESQQLSNYQNHYQSSSKSQINNQRQSSYDIIAQNQQINSSSNQNINQNFQRRFGSYTEIEDDAASSSQHKVSTMYQNSSSGLGNNANRKISLFQDIKNRMELFKTQNRESITKHLKYIANKINDNKQIYYNFFDEENKVALKFLVQVLYDEVEKLIVLDTGNSLPLKLKMEDLQREINEKNKKIHQLEEELIEKNLQINSMTSKVTRYTQRFNDLRWILEESKRIYEDFISYQQDLLQNDMYAYDESRKLKFIQITNIQKEFNRLKDNFDELKIGNSNQKSHINPNQANFFMNQLTPINQHQGANIPHNSQLKHQQNNLDHSASSSSNIGLPTTDLMVKKQLEFDEDYANQNLNTQNASCNQFTNGNDQQLQNQAFLSNNINSNSQTTLSKRINRHNSVSSTSHSIMVLNKMHQPQGTNRSMTPSGYANNKCEAMYQSNVVTSDHSNQQMANSQLFNAPLPQRANQSVIIQNSNTSNSQIFAKSGNKFLDIRQQIEALENEYNELDNIQQSLEDQVAKYKHCFVEQLKLCQLLQKNVHSLEEEVNQLRQQNKNSNNNMQASQLLIAANQQQADLEKDLQKITQQLKSTQKECETLQNENKKILKEHNEIQQKYNQQIKQIQDIEEQRQHDKQVVQRLNSQFQSMKREVEEKQSLEDKIKSLTNDNNHLNKELDECLGLLESGKINIEQLKITLQQKEDSSSDLIKKNANLENQVFLKQKEIDQLSVDLKKQNEQLQDLQINKGKEAVKCLIDQQHQTLPQIEFLIYEENMNEDIQKETKQLIIQLFGCDFLQFIEKIQERHQYSIQFNQNLYEKLQIHCNGRIQSCEDLKVMGQMILQAYEVLSRHSHVQLPTPLMMLREEFEMKRPAIQDKLQECIYEQQAVFEEFNSLSLMNSQLAKGKNMSSSLIIQEQQQKQNEIVSLKQRIENLSAENIMLQQNLKNYESQLLQIQNSSTVSSNKLPRPSIEHNRQSDIQSCRSSKRPSRLKQDQDDYQSTCSISGLNSVKNAYSPQKLAHQLLDVNEDFLQLILSQASSIEQLLNQ